LWFCFILFCDVGLVAGGKRSDIYSWDLIQSVPEPIGIWLSSSDCGSAPMFLFWFCDSGGSMLDRSPSITGQNGNARLLRSKHLLAVHLNDASICAHGRL